MFNFLSSIRVDFTNAQIASTEERIDTLNKYIKECKERAYDLEREIDHYEDQLVKSMEKRLDLIDMMEAAPTTSITKQTHKLA
jgi:uncharacterized coiled-coil DUF342 family protein